MREHEESIHDADSNHEVPNVEPKDELDTWVDFTVRATHTAIGLKWNQSWTIRQRRNFWTQARVMAKNTEDIGQSFSPIVLKRYQPSRKGARDAKKTGQER